MTHDYFLTSARLRFTRWREDDLPLAMALWGDPEVTAYIGGPFTPEMVRGGLARETEQQREFGMQCWPFFLLEGNRHAGCAGLRPYFMQERVYELGIHLRRDYWGMGLAKEAAARVVASAVAEARFCSYP